MGLSLPKSNLIFLKKCLDKWVHFMFSVLCIPIFKWFTIIILFASPIIFTEIYAHILETKFNSFQEERKRRIDEINSQIERLTARLKVLES